VFAANVAGQWALRQGHQLLSRIPIVKSIYTSVQQVSDTLFSSSGNAFRQAVLVEYPRAGSWTIAFVTGKPGGEAAEKRRRRARDERGRGAQVRHLDGRRGAGRQARQQADAVAQSVGLSASGARPDAIAQPPATAAAASDAPRARFGPEREHGVSG